jgi:hypothetical protein
MNPHHWLTHFENHAARAVEIDWTRPCEMPTGDARASLCESLATFQLGETGEGSKLKRWAAEAEARGDVPPGYLQAVAAFVAEENRHAALLAQMVRYLGGSLKERQWSAWLFARVRRLIPRLEFEIQILLSAELIGRAYYGLLAKQLADPATRAGCACLCRDEVAHIAFHVDLFRERLGGWLPLEVGMWRAQFQLLFLAAERLVWWDHGRALRGQNISRHEFRRQSRRACVDFLRRLEPSRPALTPETPALEA